jgi:hypothetical protein
MEKFWNATSTHRGCNKKEAFVKDFPRPNRKAFLTHKQDEQVGEAQETE